jgi:hypothetical protein
MRTKLYKPVASDASCFPHEVWKAVIQLLFPPLILFTPPRNIWNNAPLWSGSSFLDPELQLSQPHDRMAWIQSLARSDMGFPLSAIAAPNGLQHVAPSVDCSSTVLYLTVHTMAPRQLNLQHRGSVYDAPLTLRAPLEVDLLLRKHIEKSFFLTHVGWAFFFPNHASP